MRVGIHAGEVHTDVGGPSGMALHIAARVLAQCPADRILLTSTVAELLAGTDLPLIEHAMTALRGVPGTWRLLLAA